ncbi:hypothetical protein SPRG_11251 [Saprolegnia parasitica CBS 223.65]|uniref:Cytochrome P450 n=1 Tax=Saprolegnia parasitica (strain CBS 223.65) TaxID=695850 RepID=A0A067BZ75_SAPPC|nr:hypothetical protein SPRG_11251 [Saprolegnia parasitica CBS 223.65]KDO23819.1 hypothetical protein SPRG_11251 [Saprolegnia parasitica CBS 223.65]|eukprot:XP_012205452.1 hypothetical protein SPRG_11251 [Saprolegnia parasitica CBS 223.65]
MLQLSHGLIATAVVLTVVLAVVLATRKTSVPTVRWYLPLLGSALAFAASPVAFLRACCAEHGSVFRVLLAGRYMTFFTSPAHVTVLLQTKALSFGPVVHDVCVAAFGHDSGFPHPSQWHYRQVHSLFTQHFVNGTGLSALVEANVLQQRRALQRRLAAPGASQLHLFSFLRQALFESSSRTLFGDAFCDLHADLLHDYVAFDDAFPVLASGYVPTWLLRTARAAASTMAQGFSDAIVEPSLMRGCSQFMLDRLQLFRRVQAPVHNCAGTQLALLWATNSNSVPTAFWTLYHLLHDVAAWDAVLAEVHEYLPSTALESKATWSKADLDKCIVLDSAIDETLRLVSASLLLREATCDVELPLEPPVVLRKGDRVAMAPFLQHMDATLFPEPEIFRFDRFVHATQAQRSALRPFGLGASMCPGRFFAKTQLKSCIALLMQHLPGLHFASLPASTVAINQTRVGMGVYPPATDTVVVVFDRA